MIQIKDSLNKTFHLSFRKYRNYLRRVENEVEERHNLLAAERWNLSRDTLEEDQLVPWTWGTLMAANFAS